ESLISAIPEPDPEKERKRIAEVYDPSQELDGQERQMHEITPGHFVLATQAEAEQYRAECGL
ncbi:ABC transporter ATP-binding protein, partial [Streptococcus equi subsp. equi]|nr:ABC transporter ATP-binding protein [Streptococcus equi subsp. equi]